MSSMNENIYLKKVKRRAGAQWNTSEYPFCIPVIAGFTELEFTKSVTYIVGDNGSGKSTLLEAIAMLFGMNPEGGSKNFNFHTVETHSSLSDSLRAARASLNYNDTFFFRAESFYNVNSEIERLGRDSIACYGGKSLHQLSHGEGFMALIKHRLSGRGIYIFDEPEAALSFQNQLAFLCWIKQTVAQGAQIIISTHSPVVLSYPDASIFEIEDGRLVAKQYQECNVYRNLMAFMTNREGCLNELGLLQDNEFMEKNRDKTL